MKLLRATVPISLAFLMFLGACRSANSLFKKAIDRGLKIDTAWQTKVDPLKIGPVRVTMQMKAVDTPRVVEICRDLVKGPSAALPILQEEVCPDVDTTITVNVHYRDAIASYPLRITAKGGKLQVNQSEFELPISREEGTTTITPGIGQGRAVLLCAGALVIGMVIGALAVSGRKR